MQNALSDPLVKSMTGCAARALENVNIVNSGHHPGPVFAIHMAAGFGGIVDSVPNDPYLDQQWYLGPEGGNVKADWEITKGAEDITL